MSYQHAWTEEETTLLRKLWARGLTGSEIAAQFANGFTRKAIIGKAWRLQLERRAPTPIRGLRQTHEEMLAKRRALWASKRISAGYAPPHTPSLAPINGKARHMQPRLWKARHASPVPAPAYAGEPKLITELPAGRGCRYAVTDDKPFRFCGAPGYPWCEHHQAIVWRPL